ncbi:MAG: aspartate/glutamate racemase family protein [Paludibacteraceae bacterium]|nr:aspartate/glutamate racemase family protein [Paludibacteraceae bacterium]
MAKIGVFDSGYGGLTILDAIRKTLPQYDYLYLGDNARAPYGTHSFDVIYRYTLQAVQYLIEQDCALIILACNTASAKALRTIQQQDLPPFREGRGRLVNVLGVIRPTVEAVPSITQTGHVGILATPATVSSESYVLELQKMSVSEPGERSVSEAVCQQSGLSAEGGLVITQQACPLWVPLIEAGEHNSDGAKYFVGKYLREILAKDPLIDTLILGCTHYPLLKEKIEGWLRYHEEIEESEFPVPNPVAPIQIISQGTLVADSLKDYLTRHPEYESQLSQNCTCRYLTTENADRFSQSASIFLAEKISAEHVDL